MAKNTAQKAFLYQSKKANNIYQLKDERGKLIFTGFSVEECKDRLLGLGLSLYGIVYAEKSNRRHAVLLLEENGLFRLLNANAKRSTLAEFPNVQNAFDYCGENGLLIVGFCGGVFGKSEKKSFSTPLLNDIFRFCSRWKKPGKEASSLFSKVAQEIYNGERLRMDLDKVQKSLDQELNINKEKRP